MSYDLEVGVRVWGTEQYVCIDRPEYDHPTYNLGMMFRKATGWDFEQGKWYCTADVIDNINVGISELRTYPGKYRQYEPENHWGTVKGAVLALESLRDCIYETSEYNDIEYENLFVRW